MKTMKDLWPKLHSAIEVAMLGDLTVSVYIAEGYSSGFKDYQIIKRGLTGIFDGFAADGDIKVLLEKPKHPDAFTIHKSRVALKERIDNANNIDKPTSVAAKTLLRTYCGLQCVSTQQYTDAEYYAVLVAGLEGATTVEAGHMAYAIQLVMFEPSRGYNAETKEAIFGRIRLPQYLLTTEAEDRENAIEYLKSLR